MLITTGLVFAKDISEFVTKFFTNSNKAIDAAVENGYIQTEEMDFVYDKDIGVKLDSLVLDDLNLNISFNFETKKENIKSIRFENFNITNDNNKVVFRSEFEYFPPELIYLSSEKNTYQVSWMDFNEDVAKIYFDDIGAFIENSDKINLHLDFFDTIITLVKEVS